MEPNATDNDQSTPSEIMGLSEIMEVLKTVETGIAEQLEVQMSPMSTSPSAFLDHLPQQSSNSFDEPYIKIVVQPEGKALRYRYKCEGRSAGSIPGVSSTPDNKTYPTIEIVGFKGEVSIVVSCVTKDEPYRPHPHSLVGRDCDRGICQMKIKGDQMRAVFSNIGIQCVKKKEVKEALEEREELKIDPFKTKFDHKDQPSTIDLNVVRLCFQAYISVAPRQYKKLRPVVSEPIFDKKSVTDLAITRLCSCSARVEGGDEIILLCEKLPPKDEVKIRFFEVNADNHVIWEDYGQFQPTDIHKQSAIAFKTPRYHNPSISHSVKVFIQLERSDGHFSEPLDFDFYPSTLISYSKLHRNLKRKTDMNIFEQILSVDSERTRAEAFDIIDDEISTDSTVTKSPSEDNDENDLRHKIPRKSPIASYEMEKYNQLQIKQMDNSPGLTWNNQQTSPLSINTNTDIKCELEYASAYNFVPNQGICGISPISNTSHSPYFQRSNTTPSPNLIRVPSAENPTQMYNHFNQTFTNDRNHTTYQSLPQTNPNLLAPLATNVFINPTSGGSMEPINQTNNLSTPYFQSTSPVNQLNITCSQITSQFCQNQQQPQQEPNTAVDALNTLMEMDRTELVPLNSENLRLSNLSIST